MLEAIADFWKPLKKSQPQEKLQADELQLKTTIAFGIVPQASLSGRKMPVAAINTYQLDGEALTSFVLGQDKDSGVSMIIAESEGEQYLAISRRLSISDRIKLFASDDLESIIEKPEAAVLSCREAPADIKGWTVSGYKREIQGVAGRIFKGDFRKIPLPFVGEAQEFKYTLLVSDDNEHAIEIEKYNDGRIEVYATVYRRVGDVAEVSHPPRVELNRPDLKLASKSEDAPTPPPAAASPKISDMPKPAMQEKPGSPVVAENTVKTAPIKLPELPKSEITSEPVQQAAKKPEEKTPMSTPSAATNGASPMKAATESKPKLTNVSPASDTSKQEIKAVTKTTVNGMDNESIECELRVANKIIDEAIRNEMRLSDVVRRVIELPVAHQEQVHIPITLSDDDYALLAIRYGLAPTDRNAIKSRIIEDLNSFSGESKKKAA